MIYGITEMLIIGIDTKVQSDVETAMLYLGYSTRDYFLSYTLEGQHKFKPVIINPEIKAVYEILESN